MSVPDYWFGIGENNMNCPVCNKKKYKKIFEINKNTKYGLEYHDNFYKSISTPFVKVSFVECDNCNFLFNKIYKQLDYKVEYNANRSYSKFFANYLDSVVKFLDTYTLSKRGGINNILEIGFGDGEFLKKLSNSNNFKNKKFYGFDPTFKKNFKIDKCKLSNQYYNEKTKVKPDLIILRHTLEHISKVKFFLNKILHKNPKYLFIEIPCKSFVYQNKEGRRLRRTVLVLEPKLKNESKKSKIKQLLHGIQLEISNLPTNPEIKKILESAGKTEIVDEDKKIYRVELDGKTQNVYKKLKTLIKRHGIYRTYSYDEARKSSVILEDLKLPTQFLKELKDED